MILSDREAFNEDFSYLLANGAPQEVVKKMADIWMKWNTPLEREIKNSGKIISINDDPALKYEAFGEKADKGYRVLFDRLRNHIRFRKDELSIVTGINGHGKSMFLSHLSLDLMDDGATVLVASLEMRRCYLYKRLMRQITGIEVPSFEYMTKAEEFYKKRMFFVDHLGSINGKQLLKYMEMAYDAYGCDVFIVDSLMKCGLTEDDYNAQAKFVDSLCDFKSKKNVHIILVAHPRKGADESSMPGKMDVKGTGTITNVADNCFSIYKNNKKQEEIDKLQIVGGFIPDDLIRKYDVLFNCSKERNAGWQGTVPLWFDPKSLQYLNYYGQRPHIYVNYSNREINKCEQNLNDMKTSNGF